MQEGTRAQRGTRLEWPTSTSLSPCKVPSHKAPARKRDQAVTTGMCARNSSFFLFHQESPEIRPMAEEVQAVLHHGTVLLCEAQGFPRPSITWQREGVPIAAGDDTYYS